MAIYIQMNKLSEDDNLVIYQYGPNEKDLGKVGYEKNKKEILDIEPLVINGEKKDFLFQKAAQKLVLTAHKNSDNFPDRLVIAS